MQLLSGAVAPLPPAESPQPRDWPGFLAELLQQRDHVGRLAVMKVALSAHGGSRATAFWDTPVVLRCAPLAELDPYLLHLRLYCTVSLLACALALSALPPELLLRVLDQAGSHVEGTALGLNTGVPPYHELVHFEIHRTLRDRVFTVEDLPLGWALDPCVRAGWPQFSLLDLPVAVLCLRRPAFLTQTSLHVLECTPGREHKALLRELVLEGECGAVRVVVRNLPTLRRLVWRGAGGPAELVCDGVPLTSAVLPGAVRSFELLDAHWGHEATLRVTTENQRGLEIAVRRASYLRALVLRTPGLLGTLQLDCLARLRELRGCPADTAGIAVVSLSARRCPLLEQIDALVVLNRLRLAYCDSLTSSSSAPLALGTRLHKLELVCCPRLYWLSETWSSQLLGIRYAPDAPPVVLGHKSVQQLLVTLPRGGWDQDIVAAPHGTHVGKLELLAPADARPRSAGLSVERELVVRLAGPARCYSLADLGLARLPPTARVLAKCRVKVDTRGCAGAPSLVRIKWPPDQVRAVWVPDAVVR